jgi:hypothetical protein
MARPRVIRIGEGIITLKNFSPEQVLKIEALLSGMSTLGTALGTSSSAVVYEEEPTIDASPVAAVESSLPSFDYAAIGLAYKQGNYSLVRVGVDLDSNQAAILEVIPADGRADGVTLFKTKAVDLGMV